MIRFATLADLEPIVALSREFYNEIDLDAVGYRFDDPQIRESYLKGIDCKDHFVLLYLEQGELLGLFFFSIREETYYFQNRTYGSEIVWHADPKLGALKRLKVMIKLFEAGEMFMQSRGVKVIYCGLDARPAFHHPGIHKYLQNRGYAAMATTYHRGFDNGC